MTLPLCIVGASLAGGTAALTLRRLGYEGEIILIGEEDNADYDRPSLSKAVLCGELEAPPPLFAPGWLIDNRIEFAAATKVTGLDLRAGEISLSKGHSIRAGKVLLSTGSRARLPMIQGIDLGGVCSLRTDRDSLHIRSMVGHGREVVIIGGGLIGCEVATSLAKLGCKVTIVESAQSLLLRVLGQMIGAWMRDRLEALGVTILTNLSVVEIEGEKSVEGVRLDSGQRLPADIVLVAIGAEPNSEVAALAGLDCAGGVHVDASGRTASPMVYAAGDVANWPVRGGSRRSLETYLNSQAQAEIAASAMLDLGTPGVQVPNSWTEIAGHRLQMAGDIAGPGTLHLRGQLGDASSLLFRIDDGKVAAAIAINSPAEFGIAKRMVDEQSKLQVAELSDPTVRLRDIHKKNREVVP